METTPAVAPTPAAAAPAPRPEPPAPKREASIGKSVVIKGDIFSKEDLNLDGKIQGTVDMPGNRLTVGTNGRVEAAIKAREVVVLGAVRGNIEAGDRIIIRKDAHLEGDLKSASISIEDGAYFKGSIDIVRPAPVAPTPTPTAPKPPVQEPLPTSPKPSPGATPLTPSAGPAKVPQK